MQTTSLGRFRKTRPDKEQSSEKTSELCSQLDFGGVVETGSRVEMNAENGALDPVPTTIGNFCQKNLTGVEAVIHGLSSAVPAGLIFHRWFLSHTLSPTELL